MYTFSTNSFRSFERVLPPAQRLLAITSQQTKSRRNHGHGHTKHNNKQARVRIFTACCPTINNVLMRLRPARLCRVAQAVEETPCVWAGDTVIGHPCM